MALEWRDFTNLAPNYVWDWTLGKVYVPYEAYVQTRGDETVLMLAWRSLFHALAGFLVCLPFFYPFLLPLYVTAVIAAKEIVDNVGSIQKRVIDVSTWALGSCGAVAIGYLI